MPAHVLVVEDNEVNAYLVRYLLESAGLSVAVAGNGELALSAAAARRPDLVLMDIRLPVMDGYEATRRMKADPALAAVPVVALSANALPHEKAEALASGCVAHLEKPIDTGRFIDQVRAFIDGAAR